MKLPKFGESTALMLKLTIIIAILASLWFSYTTGIPYVATHVFGLP